MANQDIRAQIELEAQKAEKEVSNLQSGVEKLANSVENLNEKVDNLGQSRKNNGKNAKDDLLDRVTLALTINKMKKLSSIVSKLTDYTSEYTTSVRLLNTTFGTGSEQANKYVKSLSEMSGIDETTLNKQVALFGQLGESLNLDSQYAEKFAENLTTLATKMSILYNSDFSSMATSLQKAVQGTQTTLKSKTGIQVTDQSMQAFLSSKGISTQVSALNNAEKAMVKYAVILERVTNDSNVYSDAVNSVAWQKQMLSAQVKRLATAFGNMLYPILQKILPVLNAILMVMTEIINVIAKLLGFSGDTSTNISNTASSFEALSTGIDNASKSANKSLRGFDKLNNITTPTSGTSAGGISVDPAILGLLDETNDQFLNIQNKATEIRDRILEWLGFTRDENGELKWTADTFLKNIIDGLKELWDKLTDLKTILLIIAGILAFMGLKKLFSLFQTAPNLIAKAFSKLATGVSVLMILGGVALVIKEVVDLIKVMSESGMSVYDTLTLIGGVLLEIVAAMTAFMMISQAMDIVDIIAFIALIGGMILVLESVTKLVDTFANSGLSLGEALGFVGGILAELLIYLGVLIALSNILVANPLALVGLAALVATITITLKVLEKTLPTILDACSRFITSIAPYIIQLIVVISNAINSLIYALGIVLPPIIDSVGNLFGTIFNGISIVVNSIGNVIVAILNTIKNLVVIVLREVLNFINEAGPAINRFVDNIIEAVTKLINFMISGINYLVNNLVLPAIRKIIQAVNLIPGVDIDVPSRFNLPKFVPSYQDGGFPDGEDGLFYANHNELIGKFTNGKTAVANNDDIVKGIQQGVFNGMMSAISSKDFETKVTIEASGDGDGLLDFINFKQKQKERQFN